MREVVTVPEARYFGGRVEEHSLVLLGEARLGRVGSEEWSLIIGSAFRRKENHKAPSSARCYSRVSRSALPSLMVRKRNDHALPRRSRHSRLRVMTRVRKSTVWVKLAEEQGLK
jgi:hypothetical protein